VVLVPGVAFDPDGGRLGRGGGFYDRFLQHVSASCVTVGVCVAGQVVESVPREPHDVRVGSVLAG
jgi:5-formyltetrahydrofolate cyclo-ligase